MFFRHLCSSCQLEETNRLTKYILLTRKHSLYGRQSLFIGQLLDMADGVYVAYYSYGLGKYFNVIDNVVQLDFVKCWEPKLWVRLFGRLGADWAPWVYLHSTIIVDKGVITYMRKHKYYN